jgi:hypothetical protein
LSLEIKEIYELTISTLVVFFHPPIVELPSDPIRSDHPSPLPLPAERAAVGTTTFRTCCARRRCSGTRPRGAVATR